MLRPYIMCEGSLANADHILDICKEQALERRIIRVDLARPIARLRTGHESRRRTRGSASCDAAGAPLARPRGEEVRLLISTVYRARPASYRRGPRAASDSEPPGTIIGNTFGFLLDHQLHQCGTRSGVGLPQARRSPRPPG